MQQETLWINAKGHTRQTTAPLAGGENGSADMQLYKVAKRKEITCTKPQTPSLLVQSCS